MRALDALAWSSVWVALAAAALCAASARAMQGEVPLSAVGLALFGTLVVYNVDRLRDLERDRATAPCRSAFIEAHRGAIEGLVAGSALAAGLLALLVGLRAIAVLAPVLGLGLLHRRLKHVGLAKPFYITLAWLAVTVGLPAVLLEAPAFAGWVSAVIGATVLANVVASNLRDGEAASAALGAHVPLRLARLGAVGGVLISLAAPAPVRPLVVVPLATLAALVSFHADERYGHVVVDGALLMGAAGALLLL